MIGLLSFLFGTIQVTASLTHAPAVLPEPDGEGLTTLGLISTKVPPHQCSYRTSSDMGLRCLGLGGAAG